jgi:hypothetical protein
MKFNFNVLEPPAKVAFVALRQTLPAQRALCGVAIPPPPRHPEVRQSGISWPCASTLRGRSEDGPSPVLPPPSVIRTLSLHARKYTPLPPNRTLPGNGKSRTNFSLSRFSAFRFARAPANFPITFRVTSSMCLIYFAPFCDPMV